MISLIIGVSFLCLLSKASLAAPTATDFAELPMFSDLEISPGGKFLAARVNHHLSLYVNRLKFLTKTEKFLAACLD